MTRHSPITKFPKPRDIAAQARLFAEVAADCSRGILSGDYSEAGICAFAAETTELFREMRAEAGKQRTRKPRKPTLASVAKEANKAALDVARYEIKPDGSIVIVAGQPEPVAPKNPWLADLRKETKQ